MKLHSLLITICILFAACSTSTEIDGTLNFEDINITYYKSGGWIVPYSLSIDSTGLVKIYAFSYSSISASDSNSVYLTGHEKKKICRLFTSFNQFKRHYEPEHYITDQNYYSIILKNKTSMDTISVYDPPDCNLPSELTQIINFMDQKIDNLLN